MPIGFYTAVKTRNQCLPAILCLLLCLPIFSGTAGAQNRALLTRKLNIVKVRLRDGVIFSDAKVKQPLGIGDNLRTGQRSAAELTYTDRSVLRIPSSSDIVVRVSNQRDISVNAGSVYASLKGPGRFRSRDAVAAVRGTKVYVDVTPKGTTIRCYDGTILVASSGAQAIAGHVGTVGNQQIVSPDLIGSTDNWVGAKIILYDAKGSPKTHTVTGFDPVTGTVTHDTPVIDGQHIPVTMAMVNPPNTATQTLTRNQETFVSSVPNSQPAPPKPTQPLEFAGGSEFDNLTNPLAENEQTMLTDSIHEQTQKDYYYLDTTRDASQIYGRFAPGVQPLTALDIQGGSGSGSGGSGSGSGSSGNVGVTIGGSTGNGGLTVIVGRTAQRPATRAAFVNPPRGGIAAYVGNSGSALGFVNGAAVVGKVYIAVGGRLGTLATRSDSQLDQIYARYRDPHAGDFEVGRFQWFSGPISNSELGKLISFTTADGILWGVPTTSPTRLQFGYFDRVNPLYGPHVSAYATRLTTPTFRGRTGITLLGATQSHRNLGFSADTILPVLIQKLELYGEAGLDNFGAGFYAAGIYLPGLFHNANADLYLEYAHHNDIGGEFDANARLPVSRYFSVLLLLSKPDNVDLRPGFGIQARF